MASARIIQTLNPNRLRFACRWLAERDSALKRVLDEHGYPQWWDRLPKFFTTVHIILEQQVSLASANATFHRLQEKLDGTVTPAGLLMLTDSELKDLGLTRQKIIYTRSLAEKVAAVDFLFESLSLMSDDLVRCAMTKHKGIGNWTADIYLSECLLRCDVLPKGLDARPSHDELEAMTKH